MATAVTDIVDCNINPEVAYFGINKGRNTNEWIIAEKLGQGEFGSVYTSCCRQHCDYVAKIILRRSQHYKDVADFHELIHNEIKIWKIVENLELAPKLIQFYLDDDKAIIISEKMDRTFRDIINGLEEKQVELLINYVVDKLEILHKNGIIHGDPNLENIMFKSIDGKENCNSSNLANEITNGRCLMKFIDFGFSRLSESKKSFISENNIFRENVVFVTMKWA